MSAFNQRDLTTLRQIKHLSTCQTTFHLFNITIPDKFVLKRSPQRKTQVLCRQRRHPTAYNQGF